MESLLIRNRVRTNHSAPKESLFSGIVGLRSITKALALTTMLGALSCDGDFSCNASNGKSQTLHEIEGETADPVKTMPDRTLLEMDQYLKERDAANDKNKFHGFSCTGEEIANGECFRER